MPRQGNLLDCFNHRNQSDAQHRKNDNRSKGTRRVERALRGQNDIAEAALGRDELADPAATSTLAVTLSWRLSGRLAQFNRAGLVQDVVQRLTADFTANLERSLKGETALSDPIKPISFWSLAWAILKGRLAGRR